ncbi:hypothetical protein BDR26DRAFT_915210 [Obelidium mucronatum]|nr:hypothetical protein BDR26DRAFT_915210 [Obelidium mucronatum]
MMHSALFSPLDQQDEFSPQLLAYADSHSFLPNQPWSAQGPTFSTQGNSSFSPDCDLTDARLFERAQAYFHPDFDKSIYPSLINSTPNGINSSANNCCWLSTNGNNYPSRENLSHLGRNIRNVHHAVQASIIRNLAQDRQRDAAQARLIKQLINNRAASRNRMGLAQALLAGQQVPPQVLAQLLVEDAVLDHMGATMITRMLEDSETNRNADQIIVDVAAGHVHGAHSQQQAIEHNNFLVDTLRAKAVQHLTAPDARARFASPDHVATILQTLWEAQQVQPAVVTPQGIQYCRGSGQFSRYAGIPAAYGTTTQTEQCESHGRWNPAMSCGGGGGGVNVPVQ